MSVWKLGKSLRICGQSTWSHTAVQVYLLDSFVAFTNVNKSACSNVKSLAGQGSLNDWSVILLKMHFEIQVERDYGRSSKWPIIIPSNFSTFIGVLQLEADLLHFFSCHWKEKETMPVVEKLQNLWCTRKQNP